MEKQINKINIAPRGRGTVDKDGVIQEFKVLSYDIVSFPSFDNATIILKPKSFWKRITKFFIDLFKLIF